MCLAVPGKIISIATDRSAEADFGGTRRKISLDLAPSAKTGDYVLVHAGFAIQILDEKDAVETLRLFKEFYGGETH